MPGTCRSAVPTAPPQPGDGHAPSLANGRASPPASPPPVVHLPQSPIARLRAGPSTHPPARGRAGMGGHEPPAPTDPPCIGSLAPSPGA
ncbi:hypothetical protein P7K49_033674 [Saguinus oedipus]|uniref:Uncharacterized protein n=1 Tax=Saguinus oedipus TaxID=9490 RepID=A0ABQ9TSL5_SAGOE|nr:hypothetical protein P7K49_033674 [Saguinus oedipus]